MALRTVSDDDHFAGPDEVTAPINVAEFREKLDNDRREQLHTMRRSLHTAASAAAQAGDALKLVYSKIGEALAAIDSIVI